MLIGYARVSTVLALQRDALAEAGCEHIYTEQLLGAVADRRELARETPSAKCPVRKRVRRP
jgi:DNA invertase Pin-like site-specific DNA recombinase